MSTKAGQVQKHSRHVKTGKLQHKRHPQRKRQMTQTPLDSDKNETQSNCQNHLTFDVDWAPDASVDEIRKLINPLGIKATFFITHSADILNDLINDGHEIGIHPNFLTKSSHGDTPEKVIEFLLNIVPNARALRTHALVQSSPLLQLIFSKFPQLKYDLSVFMYDFPCIKKFEWASEGTKFTRINYNWEDDAAFFHAGFNWSKPHFPGRLNIYDFHPIHIHLNSKDNSLYNLLKKSLDTPLSDISGKQIAAFANSGYGTKTFLKSLTASKADFIDFERLLCVSE